MLQDRRLGERQRRGAVPRQMQLDRADPFPGRQAPQPPLFQVRLDAVLRQAADAEPRDQQALDLVMLRR
ncbi:hypothetical protein G6F68_018876 [Rhizopus microsporus]|nr:hypothetical protein G6F68_018876 [Rhizopus microsporus]